MKCSKCNFENDNAFNFCLNCGNALYKAVDPVLQNVDKNQSTNVEQSKSSNKKSGSFSLDNIIIFVMFTITLILFFSFFIIGLLPVFDCEAGACSGFFLLIVPILIGMFSIPLVIGWIISIFNMIFNKNILLIFEFISCLISIFILFSDLVGNSEFNLLYTIVLILLFILMIVCLLKFIICLCFNSQRK